jgi:integrase
MNRPRKQNRELPACVYLKHGSYFYVKNGKWHNLGKDKKTALAEYSKRLLMPNDGVAGLLAEWFSDLDVSAATRKSYRHGVKVLSKVFAEFDPHQVTARDVLAMMHHFRKKPASANLYRNVLLGAMDLAFMKNIIERNVVVDVKPYPINTRDRYITDVEFMAIRDKATPTLKVVMDLCYQTGQRISDVLAIKYSDLTDEGIYVVQSKTKHRMVIGWSPELRQVIADAKALHKCLRGMTLLHTRRGNPFTYSTIRTLWDRARSAAKVDDVRIHDIRAKAATDAEKHGQDSKKLLGHRSESSHNRYLRSKETPVAEPVSFRQSN